MYPVWPGKALGSSRMKWKELLERGTSGLPGSACCHRNPILDRREIMDRWMDELNLRNVTCLLIDVRGKNSRSPRTP